jgi:polyferredoxin
MRALILQFAACLLVWITPALALGEQRFPPPDFRSGHELPEVQTNPGRDSVWSVIDVTLLFAALSVAAYIAIRLRSRRAMLLLGIASVAYFGFYRKGCVCPVGSVQNVAMAAFGDYALPWIVALFFLIPLLFTLLFGRVFCGGVCPLGALQDLVLIRPLQVPRWAESALGLVAYAYLGLAVLFAATGSDFIICRYDPFVGFFRFSATPQMFLLGGVLLVGGMFIGRIYCRVFCPYGVLMSWLSPISRRRVSVSPSACIDCRLCEQSCPFGAIRQPTRQRTAASPAPGDRRRLALVLLLIPLLIGVGALLGHQAGPFLSSAHPQVKLAQDVWKEQVRPAQKQKPRTSDQITAFQNSGRSAEALFADAGVVRRRTSIGAAVIGGFLGLAVGLKLASHSVYRGSNEYLADPGTCLACARCFRFCPVEQERLAGRAISLSIIR